MLLKPGSWLATRGLALGVGLAMAALLFELGARLLAPAWLEQRMKQLSAGDEYEIGTDERWPIVREKGRPPRFRPGSSFVVRHFEYEHEATIDELGGRAQPRGTLDGPIIPVLGDSFTFGVGVADTQTFLALVAPRIPARLVNLGVSGSCLHDHLSTIEMRHRDLGSPRAYLFFVFTGNDLSDISARHQVAVKKHPARPGLLWHLNTEIGRHPWLKRLYGPQLVRQALLIRMSRSRPEYAPTVIRSMRSDVPILDQQLGHFRQELERLVRLAEKLPFFFRIVLLPDVHELDRERLELRARSVGLSLSQLDPGRLTRSVVETMADFGIEAVELSPCLARSEVSDLYYVRDTHFTPTGHQKAARCLLDSGVLDSVVSLAADPAAQVVEDAELETGL